MGPIGIVDATVDVSICGVTMFIELPKKDFTKAGLKRLVNFRSSTNKSCIF